MQSLDLKELKKQLTNANIVIVTHMSPDGDAVGSSLAIYHYLQKLGNNVTVIVPDAYPANFKFLSGSDKILNFACSNDKALCLERIKKANIIFCLDFNEFKRLGKELGDIIIDCKQDKKFIVIDHHLLPKNDSLKEIFDYHFINSKACSTAILTYEFIYIMDDAELIDQTIAYCIYTGIITDTNNLTTSNVTTVVYRVIADLVDYDININNVYNNIYEYSINKLKLLGDCLKNKIRYFPDLNIAIVSINKSDFIKYNIQSGDTDGIINYALLLKGVNLAISLIERNSLVKMSFRSKNNVSASDFAKEYFAGGGHFNAAGGISKLSMEDTFKKVINVVTLHNKKTSN